MSDTPSAPGHAPRDPGYSPDDTDTRPYPDLGQGSASRGYAPPVMPPPPGAIPHASPAPRRRSGLGAAVVALALVAGAGAGVGGAAAWDAWGPEAESTSSQDGGGDGTTMNQVSEDAPDRVADGTVESVAETVLPSVVQIEVTSGQGSGSGSGIILDSEGLILTNNHVVEAARGGGSISVSFEDGSIADAEVLGADPLTDTAVIQAEGVSDLTPATIGRSGDLQVGQDVVAVGSPFGLDATVTSGIVSALNRPVNVGSDGAGNATTYPAIQTDAAINPGNSGGPLVDMNGNVVGINSSIRTAAGSMGQGGSIGLGFAIPIDEVMPIVEQMANGETPTHARLGIRVSDASTGGGGIEGARVEEVDPGSAAADAGLEVDDVITRVDDRQITGSDSLVATVRSYRPGEEVEVTFSRDGEQDTISLTLDSDAE